MNFKFRKPKRRKARSISRHGYSSEGKAMRMKVIENEFIKERRKYLESTSLEMP